MNKVCAAGWRLIIKPREVTDKIGNIHLPDSAKEVQRLAAVVAQVVSVGTDAYTGEKFHQDEPWCKLGDWVLIAKFAGMRFKVDKEEYRIINDDDILAVCDNPDTVQAV